MARFPVSPVSIDFRKLFSFLEHLLQTEQVTIDTLAVCGPRRILHVSRHSHPEQPRSVFILQPTSRIIQIARKDKDRVK